MGRTVKRTLDFETEWLHGYARTYLPCDASCSFSPEDLRREGITLVDIKNLFANAVVVSSDKLDEPGARWIVHGHDGDGRRLKASIIVISQECQVRLESVSWEDRRKDDPHDAA